MFLFLYLLVVCFFFFFQAEDGIRDIGVTGVQTCALPISTETLIRLSDRLVRMAPGTPSKVFYGLSGSDANETQVKLVWYYNNVLGRPRKKKIISRDRGYHGASILSGSLTGMSFYHTAFDLPVSGIRHTRVPHHWRAAEPGESEEAFSQRCARELEELILK